MDEDSICYWMILLMLIAQRLVRLPRHRLLSMKANSPGMQEHPSDAILLLITKFSVIAVFLVYFLLPQSIASLSMNLPFAVRIFGGVAGVASLLLLWWADETLDENLSVSLQIKSSHRLITTGPYRWVCHPIYTATLIFFVGVGLLSSNWLVAITIVGTIAVLFVRRIPMEEKMMLNHFGDPYRKYLDSTGRLLPRVTAFFRIGDN